MNATKTENVNLLRRFARTPWGAAQLVDVLIPDQVFVVSTAGHGGLFVTGAALERIPQSFRLATFTRNPQWYEEDCDWAIVAHFVPEAFPDPAIREQAEKTLRAFHGPLYTAWERTQNTMRPRGN